MTTAIQMLQTLGIVLVALLARAALVVAAVAVLSLPMVAYAYAARAIEGAWHRHHGFVHAHRHA